MVLWPNAYDTDATLLRAVNLKETTLTVAVAILGNTITVETTAGFPSVGILRLEEPDHERVEFVRYTGLDATHFTGLTRGHDPDFPASEHNAGVVVAYVVFSDHHNVLKDTMVDMQEELGLNPSGPFATVADRIADAESRVLDLEQGGGGSPTQSERPYDFFAARAATKPFVLQYELVPDNNANAGGSGGSGLYNAGAAATTGAYSCGGISGNEVETFPTAWDTGDRIDAVFGFLIPAVADLSAGMVCGVTISSNFLTVSSAFSQTNVVDKILVGFNGTSWDVTLADGTTATTTNLGGGYTPGEFVIVKITYVKGTGATVQVIRESGATYTSALLNTNPPDGLGQWFVGRGTMTVSHEQVRYYWGASKLTKV